MLPGEGFDPTTGKIIKQDSGIKRMMRGFMGGKWYMNVFNILVCPIPHVFALRHRLIVHSTCSALSHWLVSVLTALLRT